MSRMATRVVASPTADLTDTFPDVSLSQSRVSSSPYRTRHALGDSPISARPPSSSSSFRSSSSSASRRTALPSLDKLLAFLDDEPSTGDEQEQQRASELESTPVKLHHLSPPPAPLHTHSKSIRLSPLNTPATTVATTSTSPTQTTQSQSPSARTERSRREKSNSSGGISLAPGPAAGQPWSEAKTVGRARGKGVEERLGGNVREGDSPSPKMGKARELRERSLRESTEERERNEMEVRAERDRELAAEVSRIADEVLDEFDSIISRNPSPSLHNQSPYQSRPRSRLRNIPSPALSLPHSVSPTSTAYQFHQQQVGPSSPRLGRQEHPPPNRFSPPATSIHDDEDRRTQQWVGRSQNEDVGRGNENGTTHRDVPHVSVRPQPIPPSHLERERDRNEPSNLVQELREAKLYIAQLHAELREIAGVVGGLRGHGVGVGNLVSNGNGCSFFFFWCREMYNSCLLSSRPLPPNPPAPTRAPDPEPTQALWDIARHLLSLLPSPNSPSSLPLETISSALQFARDMDRLVEGRERREGDVFGEGNLERVGRRVGSWERAVRTGRYGGD
ncbi:hypothetical protein P7C70_g1447, partial [Phenoliferia sp. Uapishka_3]